MANQETRRGYATTEFYLALLAELFGFLMISGIMDFAPADSWISKVVGGAIAVLAALGYTSNRTKAKAK